jgi:hypothetical protein
MAANCQFLETRGLPKIDRLMCGRYVPAVRAFFDHLYGLNNNCGARRSRLTA